MSRIILTKWEGTDEPRFVVGWDRPCSSYFWQEFQVEPKVAESGEGKWKVTSPVHKVRVYDTEAEADEHKWDDWEEMLRYAGYIPSEIATIGMFEQSCPPDILKYVTPEVLNLLVAHSMDPEAGRIVVDMTTSNVVTAKSYKVEVQTYDSGGDRWSSNAVRFATEEEAQKAALDLAGRWTMVKNHRVTETNEPVNYKWENGGAVSVTAG